jgi:hypothetical protein
MTEEINVDITTVSNKALTNVLMLLETFFLSFFYGATGA